MKTFQQCPKKYYHTKIAKDVVEPDTKATLYGKSAHTAAEEYIRDKTPIPPAFEYMKPTLDALDKLEGDKLCEVKLGLTKNLEPCHVCFLFGYYGSNSVMDGHHHTVLLADV